MMPSPSDLTYFVEVAEALNLSRASERLGISQPSLSLAMRRLEDSVGTQLLLRSKRGVTLTQGGRQLLTHAKYLLQSWDSVKTQTLASVNDIQGSYTIGCHPSVALNILPAFLPELMRHHPKLDIRLRHDLSRRIAEDVISLKIDIGVVVNPVQHPDLVIHRLCEDEVTLWAGPRCNKTVLICDPDLAQSQSLLKRLKKHRMVFERIISSGNLEVIAELTAAGCGIGILPAKVAGRARKPLQRVPKAPVFLDEHCLIYRVENKNVKTIQALSAAIKGSMAKTAI